jgi:hypothetical protein
MIGNVSRDSSSAVVCGGVSISEDVAWSACVTSGICNGTLEGMKTIAREAMIHAPHSQRVGLRRICADRSSTRAATPMSKLTTMEYSIQDNI